MNKLPNKIPNMFPNAAPAWLSLLAAVALLGACAKNPSEADTSVKDNEDAEAAQVKSDSEAAAMLLPAYQLNRDASSRARLNGLKSTASEPEVATDSKLPAFGEPPAGSGKPLAPKPQPNIAAALLKRGLGKASAAAGADTSYFVNGDSLNGLILYVRAYTVTEGGAPVEARDTLTYKAPYTPTNRTVLAHSGTRAYANGSKLRYVITDEDGDNILNEAVAGKKVQLHKLWITTHGDTTWKSIKHTTHGSTNYYDSLGEGSPTGWTDTTFVSGKVVAWQRIFDGDEDGFILTAAAGKKVKVNRASYSEVGGGVFRQDLEAFGPGADGNYLESADNERYAWRTLTVDGSGKNVSEARHGDGDGDGFYWNPAAAENKAYSAVEYVVNDSIKEYVDSLVQTLAGAGGADGKVTYFSSKRKFVDGRNLLTYTRMPGGKAGFGSADTVQVWEKADLSAWNRKADVDSTLRVTWMIPGVMSDPSDDKIAMWYSQVWNRAGASAVSASEMMTATVAYSPASSPKAGTYVRDERVNPVSSKSVIRTVLFKEFDLAAGAATWRRTDYFENGDSTVSQGGGVPGGQGTYSQALGQGAKNTGFYDAATGSFEDTTSLLGFAGEAKSKEIAWGKVDPAKGTGDYHTKRLTGKDTATAHVVVKAEGTGLLMTRTTAKETTVITFKGDSAAMVKTDGGVKRTYVWSAGSGAYRVAQTDVDAKTEAPLATGDYFFGQDLSGAGAYTKTSGKKPVEAKVQFQSDGSVFQDGVKVTP